MHKKSYFEKLITKQEYDKSNMHLMYHTFPKFQPRLAKTLTSACSRIGAINPKSIL